MMKKRILACILVCAILISVSASAASLSQNASKTASYLKKTDYTYNADEFVMAGLTRLKTSLTASQKKAYAQSLKSALKASNGVLDSRINTVYARVVIGLTAIGYDPVHFEGYDLTAPLKDTAKTVKQGLNGAIWALIALDSGEYIAGIGVRDAYVDKILEKEVKGGGFDLTGKRADPDVTAMALTALSRYTYRSDVAAAVKRGISKLSSMQLSDGGYMSYGVENPESAAQVIIAMQALGISLSDSRFVKQKHTVQDGMMKFARTDGSFSHMDGGEANAFASEQALLAMAALTCGGNVYSFAAPAFSDMANHEAREATTALSKKGILNGFGDGTFRPDETMTRAQFAATVVRTLGLKEKKVSCFKDVSSSAWYAGYIGAAYEAGIILGRSASVFDPEGTITVVEAKIMLARAAKVLKVKRTVPAWTANSPKILRHQVAQEVYVLMGEAGKL